MKRYLILVLALVLAVSMIACKSNSEKETEAPVVNDAPEQEPTAPEQEPTQEPAPVWPQTITDEWVMTRLEEGGMSFNPADFGMEGSFTFDGDGNVVIKMSGEDDISTTYTVNGDTVTIKEDTGEITGTYDPETDTITFDEDNVRIVIARKGSVPEPVETSEPSTEAQTSITEDVAVGTWSLTKARVGTTEVPVSMIGMEMAFVFEEGGKASMISDGQTTDGAEWSIRDGEIVLGAGGTELYTLTYDGTALTLHESNSGADLIFEKQN